jgi:glycosyltransferase involved in cell wall biosynthesis
VKILWLCNKVFSGCDYGETGTWLGASAQRLVQSGEIELGNIGLGAASAITRQDFGPIKQWVVPSATKLNHDGLPSGDIVSAIVRAVNEFDPDIVHVWGTESFLGLLTARKFLTGRALLETQGLKFAIAKVFNGDLSLGEQGSCAGFKEIVRSATGRHIRKEFENWGRLEKEMIDRHQFITVQTEWLEAQVRQYNDKGQIFRNEFMLRDQFYSSSAWKYSGNPIIFCTAAYPAPFKGLHVAARALSIMKKRIPSIQLRIAGAHQRKGLHQDGYIAWVNREIFRLGIEENVTWLGPLSAPQIIDELLASSAAVIPSFIEGYCLGLAEAMMVGTPAVASFVGGIPCIARDDESALFFPPGDAAMCAHQLMKVISNNNLAIRLSQTGRTLALTRNNREAIQRTQMAIYRRIVKESPEKTDSLQ